LKSKTRQVVAYRFTFKDDHKRSLVLIDTPGFDHTDHLGKSNKEILEGIVKAFKNLYVLLASSHSHNIIHAQQRGSGLSSSKGRVSGIFYLYPNADDEYMTAAASTNRDMFQQLGGGGDILRRVIFIRMSSQSADPKYVEYKPREEELRPNNKSQRSTSNTSTSSDTAKSAQEFINQFIRIRRSEESGQTRQRR
jgi:hypothetical protein